MNSENETSPVMSTGRDRMALMMHGANGATDSKIIAPCHLNDNNVIRPNQARWMSAHSVVDQLVHQMEVDHGNV